MDEAHTTVIERPKHRNQHPPAVTKLKQTAYLTALSETGSHGQACKLAQIALVMPFQWATTNGEFRKRREEALLKGEQVLLAAYESNLDEVLLPIDPMNLDNFARLQNSRMFRMKRLDPRYRDNAVVEVNVKGPAAIQFNLNQVCTQDAQAAEQVNE